MFGRPLNVYLLIMEVNYSFNLILLHDCRSKQCLSYSVNEGVMADHTSPLESGQLLSPDIPILASPPPPQHPPNIVNGDGPQQVG